MRRNYCSEKIVSRSVDLLQVCYSRVHTLYLIDMIAYQYTLDIEADRLRRRGKCLLFVTDFSTGSQYLRWILMVWMVYDKL